VPLPERFSSDLAALTEALHHDEPDLNNALVQLLATGMTATAACCGMSITVATRGHQVTFTLLLDGVEAADVASSLLLPLPLFTATEPGSRLVLFARRAGAFVDLAADLSQATALAPAVFTLDRHLDVASATNARTGLSQLRIVNQAIGVLIARGMTLDDAAARLDELAAAAATTTYVEAVRILAELESR
jgi:hypothetical protein